MATLVRGRGPRRTPARSGPPSSLAWPGLAREGLPGPCHDGAVTTDAPPYAQPDSGHPPVRPRRRWLRVAVVSWAVLLPALAYVSIRHGAPTVREQRSVGQAAPVVDRAVGAIVAAAGSDAVVELGGPRLDAGCRLSVVRSGVALDRLVTVRTAEADAPGLLERIAGSLPASYRAGTRPGQDGNGPTLRADAGEFVSVTGGVTAPGVIELTAATGCRPAAPRVNEVQNLFEAPVDEQPARVFAALGLPATGADHQDRTGAPCPGGGAARTARAARTGTPPAGLAAALRPLAGAGPVVADQPELYAYRSGQFSVVVRTVDGETRVAVSTGCPR